MKKALLVIDIQNGMTLKKKLYDSDLFFETVNRAIDAFRAAGELIIFVQHNNKQLVPDTEDWQLDSRLHKEFSDLVFEKSVGNAFSNSALTEALRTQGVSDVVICGLVTHGCVYHSCLGAQSEGFHAAVLSGGHTSWHAQAKEKIVETEAALKNQGIAVFSLS